jgi:hypothetical protein
MYGRKEGGCFFCSGILFSCVICDEELLASRF